MPFKRFARSPRANAQELEAFSDPRLEVLFHFKDAIYRPYSLCYITPCEVYHGDQGSKSLGYSLDGGISLQYFTPPSLVSKDVPKANTLQTCQQYYPEV